MNEMLMILVFALSGALFAIGGTGYKWARRFIFPALLGLFAGYCTTWWQGAIYAVLLCASLHLGYGERTSYHLKFVVFITYSAVSLVIGFSWWVIVTPVTLFLLFMASNWKPMASSIFWKSWEFLAGILIGISFVASILNRW